MAISKEDILERLVQSSEGQKIQADIVREQQAERIRLQCQVTELKKERGAATAELSAAVDASGAKLEQARAAMAKAEQEHRLAQQKLAATSAGFDGRISQAEAKFLATAPQAITDCIQWLTDQADEVRSMEIQRKGNRTGRFHTASGAAECDWFSTAATQEARINAIRQAIDECHRLKTMVLDDADLSQRLEEMKDSLPPVRMTFEGRR